MMIDPGVPQLDVLATGLAGRYRIERPIGLGGMAVVYLATDLKHGRSVALKVLRPEISAAVGAERFVREIRISAGLTHPHIVPVHDSGEVEGILYYVMPFVEGETLRDRLDREGRLPIEEAVGIARQVAEALAHAHSAGVVHRDLKPENILLMAGNAVVADFGIARAVDVSSSEDLTRTGIAIGTPTYMSPEQAAGEGLEDHRSDIYSLGCVLYEMLTGAPPHEAATAIAVLVQRASGPPPPVRRARPELSVEVDAALMKALATSPDDRFDNATEFRHALRPRLPAGSGGGGIRRTALIAGALLLAALLTAIVGRQLVSRPTSKVPVVAVLPFENLGPPDEDYFTAGITDEVSSRIAQIAGITVIAQASAAQFDLQQTTLAKVAESLHADYVIVGSIRTERRPDGTGMVRVTPRLVRTSDGVEVWSDRIDADLTPGEIIAAQGRIAESVASELHVQLLPGTKQVLATRPTANLDAYDAYLRGNLFASRFLVPDRQSQAIAMYQRAIALDSTFAVAYARLAQVQALFYYFFDRRPERLAQVEAAVAAADRLAPGEAQTHIARGYLRYWGHLDYDGAMREFDAARSEEPANAELLWAIGSVQRRQGRFEEALESFRRAADLDPRNHLFVFETGGTLNMLRRIDEALVYVDQAVALAPDWLPGLVARPLILVAAGRIAEARADLTRLAQKPGVLEKLVPFLVDDAFYRKLWRLALPAPYQDGLDRLSLSQAPFDSAAFYMAKAGLYQRRDQKTRTLAYFDSARAVLEGRSAARPTDAALKIDLGMAYAGLGLRDRAAAEAAAADTVDMIAQDAFRGTLWETELARLHLALGQRDDAIRLVQRLCAVPATLTAPYLRADPEFRPIVNDPRIARLPCGG